jgi:hypothetical protein
MASKRRHVRERPARGAGFRRETDLRRSVNSREELRSVLIVSNGIKTEIDYFNTLRGESWVTADKVTPKFVAGAPAAVSVRAAAIRQENGYDEAWVVCDVDEFDVKSAIAEVADLSNVELVLSKPCFEVWLILHLADGCPGFNNAAQAEAYLKRLLPRWDKTALKFADFGSGVLKAEARAKRLGEPPDANPSTAVWRLIESLREQG